MLIHMAPDEVRGLQALAMAHGGSLTINPDTGLPEAGFLDKLLPTIIGAGLTFFSGGAINPMMAAGIVGGIQTVRTGDIGKGLAAGLGAYGGAGLTSGLTTAGTGALSAEVGGEALKAAGLTGEAALTAEADQIAQRAIGEKLATATPYETLSAGASQAVSSPQAAGAFLKDNAKNLMYAAGPAIMAGANVQKNMPQTTTNAAYHPYVYDPYGGGYESLGNFPIEPRKAAEGGLMGMADGGYSPGQLDFAQRSEPVVRMADGGFTPEQFKQQMYAGGVDDSAATKRGLELASQAGLNAQQTTDLWNQALGTKFNVDDYSRVAQQYGIAGPQANVDFVKGLATNDVTAPQFLAETTAKGLSQQDVNAALLGSGLSKAAQFALTNQNIGSEANTAETYGGLKGLSNNINYWLEQHPGASAQDIRREMTKWDLSDADFIRATGTDVNNYATGSISKVQNLGEGVSGNKAAVVNDNGTITQTALGDVNTITNADGTKTVMPTTTIQNIKDLYTKGGGSLGYVNNAPKTMAEFDTRFNKLTGGSKQAYDYLMGKTPYSATPWTPTGEVMKPYAESVLGVPLNKSTKKYLFDPETKSYKLNPDYQAPVYDPVTRLRSSGMSSSQVLKGLQALPDPTDDKATYDYMVANKLTPEQVAAALGPNANLASIREKYNKFKGTTGSTTDADKTINVLDNQGNTETATLRSDGKYHTSGGNTYSADGVQIMAGGGLAALTMASGGMSNLGSYSDGGRLLRGPGDGVSDSIPAVIGRKQPARLADGEFVVPARIVSELGNGSTEAGARKLYAMMDRVQSARRHSIGKGKVAKNSRSDKYLPA
jgi:hypothetical protein